MKLKYFLSIGLLLPACLISCNKKSYKPGDPLTITSIEMCDEYGDATLIQLVIMIFSLILVPKVTPVTLKAF